MYTIKLVKFLPHIVFVILTWAPYSGGEVENVIVDYLKNRIMVTKRHGECLGEAAYNEIVKNLHQLILKTGERDEYKNKFHGLDGYKWYKANCQLLIINSFEQKAEAYYEYAYIGQMPLYQYNKVNNKLDAVNFIHNIRNEVEHNTIEESCLSPFRSRSNRDIAKQIMPGEGDKLINMVSNCDREQFIEKIAHALTRFIGYCQSNSNKKGDYRKEAPVVTYGKRQLENEDLLVFYMPKTKDDIPFIQEKLDGIVRENFYEKINSFQDAGDYLELKLGDMIAVEINNNTINIKM